MTILEGIIRHDYIVTDIVMDKTIMRRLEALGINSGSRLQMMNQKKNGTVIIKVRGTRWAIGRDIAGGIQVVPAVQENKGDAHGDN
ncbi:MAG: ferrous iron transport protein A [Lachnospiraceae bacterium]|nr:ferrous iron transport protein A [Lachnospiraceae bacterium]